MARTLSGTETLLVQTGTVTASSDTEVTVVRDDGTRALLIASKGKPS
jgi:hypothetical protein